MLQYVAVYKIAVCCTMREGIIIGAACCSILQYIAVYFSILQHFAVHCTSREGIELVVRYVSVFCSVLQYVAV
jgi:hypothetical protein